MRKSPYTLSELFEYFQAQSNLRPGMVRTYTYAVQHFYVLVQSSKTSQPLSLAGFEPARDPLRRLGSAPEDVNLLSWRQA